MNDLRTGGEAAISALEAAGVEVVFGIPGVHTLSLYDALQSSSIRHILARHEQGAGFMADGYARATGKPGVAIIITGPGITNVATPVGEAYSDSSPVVVISSQIERPYRNAMRGNLHDIRDQSGLMRILTKKSVSVDAFDQIATEVYDAIQEAASGRPRPVHVELPIDLLEEKGRASQPTPRSGYRPAPGREQVEEAASRLANAAKPVIYVGGGAVGASAALTEIAEILGAPVISSVMGKGVVSEDHPYGLGHAWNPWGDSNPADDLLNEADVMLVVGSKLGAQETNYWKMPVPDTLIRVDIDPVEVANNYGPPALAIIADAAATADALLELLREQRGSITRKTAADELQALREQIQSGDDDGTPFNAHIQALRAAIPRDGIIVQDMTMMSYRMNEQYPAYTPRTYLFPSTYGTLGFSLPAAIGAKIGRPDTSVVAIAGDGGFQFTMQELATAVQFNVSLPIVIFNDSTYTAVKDAMHGHYGEERSMAVDLVNPDYVKLAEAYGIPGVRAEKPSDLQRAVTEALGQDGPTIIDVPIPKVV
jgi:thiamine pyrophosphate-dependent acetolactate synthase large subunit-like protein